MVLSVRSLRGAELSAEERKALLREALLRWHPDKNDSEEATEKFKRINCAYNTLTKVRRPEPPPRGVRGRLHR